MDHQTRACSRTSRPCLTSFRCSSLRAREDKAFGSVFADGCVSTSSNSSCSGDQQDGSSAQETSSRCAKVDPSAAMTVESIVCQRRYIANPYLINAHKFDMRLYVYVPSHDPLRIYLFDDGERFLSTLLVSLIGCSPRRFGTIRIEKVRHRRQTQGIVFRKTTPSCRYSSSLKSLSDRFMHLTNYSVNRYNSEYRTNSDSAACTGHKW